MRLLVCLLAIASLPIFARAQRPVTPPNWKGHPGIRAIRAMVGDIDAAAEHGKLTVRVDSAGCDGGAVRLTAHLYTDSAGRVRKYVLEGGSGDSAGEVRYYYDGHRRLRFTFETLGAVNGTERETRFYFDSTGSQLYKDVRVLKGPGYSGGFPSAVIDPATDFRSLCGPIH